MRRQAKQGGPLPCTMSMKPAKITVAHVQECKSRTYPQVQTEGLIRDHNVTIAFLKEELRDVKVCSS